MNGMLAVVRYQADAARRPDGIVSFHRAEELMYTILLDRAAAAFSSKRKKQAVLSDSVSVGSRCQMVSRGYA